MQQFKFFIGYVEYDDGSWINVESLQDEYERYIAENGIIEEEELYI